MIAPSLAHVVASNITEPTTDMPADLVDLVALFDRQARANIAAEPGIAVERGRATVRLSGLWDFVIYSDLTEATADEAIRREQARALPPGRKLEWKRYGHDRPTDLDVRLSAAGFEPDGHATLVCLDLTTGFPDTPLPSDVTLRCVDDRAGLADVVAVGLRAFGEDHSSMNDEFLARMEYGTVAFYVAYLASEPVGAGRLEMPRSSEFGGLFGGGTVPEQRGRGIYRALVGARVQAARARGCRYLTVDARDTSLPTLLRLGFVPLTTVTDWTWEPPPAI
jgi:GNAT superfamily N-acetyltransferase